MGEFVGELTTRLVGKSMFKVVQFSDVKVARQTHISARIKRLAFSEVNVCPNWSTF